MIKFIRNTTAFLTILIFIGFIVYSCSKLYIKQDFRQTYGTYNDSIHQNSFENDFFKVHLKNGDVSVLNEWLLNDSKDSILGKGKLFDFNRNEIKDGSMALEINEVAIIETNQLEAIKSKDKERIAGLSLLTGVNLVLDAVCITNPKACFGSCPTFYTNNSLSIHDAKAEGFSSSISPALEATDMDALRTQTSGKEFHLTMKNEAFETHLLNELFLTAIPKKKTEYVFHDQRNKFYKSNHILPPKRATIDGTNILNKVLEIDDQEFFSKTDEHDLTKKEEIYLDFNGVSDNTQGLVINFRQTLLTTFLLYSGISFMGDEVGDYFAKIETNSSIKKRLSNPFKLLGKIKLYAWNNENRQWQFFDEIYETGPISKNLIISPISKISTKNGQLKIKIELTKGLWRIDYLGLTEIKEPTLVNHIYPSKIKTLNGFPAELEKIINDDEKYLASFPGNEYDFMFRLPDLMNQDEYEVFVTSKGYYLEWIRSNWLRNKNIQKLKKMLSNNKEVWASLAVEYKIIEDEMEDVFWNSRYTNIK